MNSFEKMKSGALYTCDDKELMAKQTLQLQLLHRYNKTVPLQGKKRERLLKKLLAEMGEGCYLEPPLHANWGCNTHLGSHVYANFNLTLVDDTDIYIGDYTMIGPNVTLVTAGHPILPELRQKVAQYNIPVHIGKNVWLGAGVIVLPGVSIGDNTVIGAGSVVTKNIPAGCVAYGTPCRVIREISQHDREYYYKDRKIDFSAFPDLTAEDTAQ